MSAVRGQEDAGLNGYDFEIKVKIFR